MRAASRATSLAVLATIGAAAALGASVPLRSRAEAQRAHFEGIDPTAMDRTVDPCKDFYEYACGGWLARTKIPSDRGGWGRFDELEEENAARLREILDELAAGKGDAQLRKAGDFYAACMDEAAVESRGLVGLRAEWERLEAVKDPASLAAAVGRLHAAGFDPLFSLHADQDMKDSSQVVGSLVQGGLSLPDRDYYTNSDPKSLAIQEAYRAHVEKMLGIAGVAPAAAASEARAIFDLEKAMAESHWTLVEMRDPARLDNRLDLTGLEKLAPRFPWKAYLGAVGAAGVTAFSATTPKALARIDELVAKTAPGTWRAYLRWNVLEGASSERALPRALVEESFAFSSKNFTGAKELKPRWKHCVEATDAALGEALGQAFVRRYFSGDAKDKALALVAGVQAAQGANLASLAWMDAATRAQAQRKLGRIDNKVGYPSKWRDYTALKVDRGSYLGSTMSAAEFETKRQISQDWQVRRPQRVGHDAPDGERLLQPPDERDGLPRRDPAGSLLFSRLAGRPELRGHRLRRGPRAHPRV